MTSTETVRLGSAALIGVVAISTISFGLMLIGGLFWWSDSHVKRIVGACALCAGVGLFGSTWLWVFGWL